MRLDPDCIRSILLTVEENTSYGKYMRYSIDESNQYPLLNSYESYKVLYHIRQCYESGYLSEVKFYLDGGCLIIDLSPKGHEFLANIRSDNNWNKTKEIASKIGSYSLTILSQVAGEVVASLVKKNI